MRQACTGQTEQWLKVSAHILLEKPDRLQDCILKIYRNKPEMCCYATDLAQLRLTGPAMENSLLQIWHAKTSDSIDLIVQQNTQEHPAERALFFFADLVKQELKRTQQNHTMKLLSGTMDIYSLKRPQ